MGTGRLQYVADFASELGAVAAHLRQIPNQPIVFADSTNRSRSEDGIIARTWRHYIEEIETEDQVILQYPMTKAAKLAVDTMVEVAKEKNGDFDIDKIMPAGFSKRGWITWLLTCVDPRVFASAPIVLSTLNWNPNFHHHNRAMGGWSWAFGNYWFENITRNIEHPRTYHMMDVLAVDPFSYNPRLADIPKLLSVASGDEFFLLDDSHYFWSELLGTKFMCMFENSDHGMGGHGDRLYDNLKSFFLAIYHEINLPELDYVMHTEGSDGTLELWSSERPEEAHAFWADTTEVHCQIVGLLNVTENDEKCREEFRKQSLVPGGTGIHWEEIPFDVAEQNGPGMYYSVTVPNRDPEEGYRGVFFNLKYHGVGQRLLDFTTEVMVLKHTTVG